VLSTSSCKLFFIFRGYYSPTATTAASLRTARPERFHYKVPISPGSHHYPKFFFSKRRGKIIPSGEGSHISGFSYANIANNASRFFRFEGGRPLHNVRSLYSRSGGLRSLHTLQSVTFRNPLNIPGALLTNSSPKAFLAILSDVLSILRRSCRLVPGSFIPILHSGPFRCFNLDDRPFGVLGAISSFPCL
jgi:hypothetical protein